jgi:hypothetical protein
MAGREIKLLSLDAEGKVRLIGRGGEAADSARVEGDNRSGRTANQGCRQRAAVHDLEGSWERRRVDR